MLLRFLYKKIMNQIKIIKKEEKKDSEMRFFFTEYVQFK